MRLFIFFSVLIVALLYGAGIQAQPTKQEMWVRISAGLQKRLGLTDRQTADFQQAGLRQLNDIDSVGAQHLSLTDRSVALKKVGQAFDKTVQGILSDKQWATYRAMQDSARDAAMKRLAERQGKKKLK
ncbi:MAG: hypothetical protein JST42_09310 [Bacteroidetes bacterium]|nr:hypothetical protein [Bacteroidota bacterium]